MGVVLRLTGVTDLPFYYFPLVEVLGAGLGLTDLPYFFLDSFLLETFEMAFLEAGAGETDLVLFS